MAVFNSLGSNYTLSDVLQKLFGTGKSQKAADAVRQTLKKRYEGEVTLTYKGRQALELALKNLDLPTGSFVGINGFTCYVVYQAVQNAGLKPVFIDVPPKQLNFDVAGLQAAHKRQPGIKAIIVQNTLGVPADMMTIEAYCQQNDITIIEDLAHSQSGHYSDGREAGTVGAMTMLSFSQDKPLDIVAGGALVDRRKKTIVTEALRPVNIWQRWINRFYPFWTFLIRNLYPIGLGRYLHFGLKKMHLLATPMSDNLKGISALDPTAARLLQKRLAKQAKEQTHRQVISTVYKKTLPQVLLLKTAAQDSTLYLRFPIWVEDRQSLVDHLKSFHIYIGDTWYDAPIGPSQYLAQTNYQAGECPNAESLAAHIVNLPTHIHVNEKQAAFIANLVNAWQTSK